MILKTIRSKIIFWYTLALIILISLFSFFLYTEFQKNLYKYLDDRLLSKAEGIADSIDTYWETEKLGAIAEGIEENVFNKVNNINFIKIAQRWVKEESNDPKLINTIVQIFDKRGSNIASSGNVPHRAILSQDTLKYIIKYSGYFDNIGFKLSDGKELILRELTIPV